MSRKILCTLPFAGELINGIPFEKVEGGMQTVNVVEDDVAESFLLVPGYEAVEFEEAPQAPEPEPVAKPKAKKAAE